MSLESEFETFKAVHKFSVLKASLIRFYDDLQNTGVTVPEFMQKSVEQLADEHISRLMEQGKFNEIYERCWNKYAECLP